MDALFPALTRRFDPSKPIGYLNFSDGRPDVRFRKTLADAYGYLLELNDLLPYRTLGRWLTAACTELQASGSAAFANIEQAQQIIHTAFEKIPAAYRKHHSDLLAHQPDDALFNPFFLARACEVAMGLRAKGTPPEKMAKRSVRVLNDFVGYRPIAVLETRPQTDFYSHEKVAAVPLYFRGVGAVPGQYAEVVRTALDLLDKTDRSLLDEACLEPERLEELAYDPRATDHFHPVNKRPNVLFGEWDPHHIDGSGYFRRFVLRQGTLDALVEWSQHGGVPDPERLLEASAVLAGTILMGSGISGSGPTHYDSTVTLAKLVQKIARFRDKFYQKLLESLPGGHGSRLRAESAKLKQPFGGVRQSLNRAIAAERALHLQERRLAIFFSAMGYTEAARERANAIPAPATRMLAEIRLRQTAVQFAIRAGNIPDVPRLLGEVEELLKRGINCGALIDPWNILGFQGLFPTFADRGDTVRDPRAEDLILSVGRQFDAYASALGSDGAQSDPVAAKQLRKGMAALADWWDKFATSTVAEMPRVVGAERAEAAEHVANALGLWKSGGAADPSFWRKHLEGFRTPSAFAQVIEALLDRPEYKASMALLATWLSEVQSVPLQDASASFFRLAFRWLKNAASNTELQPNERGALVRRFMELLEANADEFWNVPEFGSTRRFRSGEDDDFDEDFDDDEDDDDDTFASAYEEMTYKDSTDDGNDSALADDDPNGGVEQGEFPFEADAEEQLERLRFLNAVARMWRLAARPELFPTNQPEQLATIVGWVRQSRESFAQLMQLCQQIHAVPVPEPLGGLDGVSEFDRRRGVKARLLDAAVQTAIETAAAARALTALLPKSQELPSATQLGPTSDIPSWEGLAVRLEKAIGLGDARTVRQLLPRFIQVFRHEPLLVCPPSDGGAPVPAIKAHVAQQMMESLLARLPRLGLLRETYQLTRLARQMERNEIPEGRRVSSFDVLFRTAVTGTTEAILTAAREWDDSANEDGPLAASLRLISESYQKLWYEHSQTLRLSSLETMIDGDDWKELKSFIRQYGGDLFTVRVMTLSNVRGILAQGTVAWLENESIQGDPESTSQLVLDWDTGAVDKARTAMLFETVLTALVEHYDEYRDYNTTTTQSDYGENLYTLLDFLRLKVTYDRHAWRLKPLVLAHEVLCKRGYDRLAAKWREFVSSRTSKLAEDLLDALSQREIEHGIKLRTVRDRLEERFVQPLRVDQAGARVQRAAAAIRDGQPENNPAFQGLLAAIRPLAEIPVGVGLDVPSWVRRLEDELRTVKLLEPDEDEEPPTSTHGVEEYHLPPFKGLTVGELQKQMRDWDTPLEGG